MLTHRFNQYGKLIMIVLLPPLVLVSGSAAVAQGPGTAFTFQGKLGDSTSPVNAALDMQFKLFDTADPATSNQIGTTITLNNPLVQVTNGVFTVQLDFGAAALPGADRFLEIGIRKSSSDPYTTLSPRSKITSAPYSVRSLNATRADTLTSACDACIQNSQISSVDATKLTGTIPSSAISASSIPAGSSSYIQNTTSPQTNSNFNISGTGTANIINAATQYNLGGSRVLSQPSGNNLFAGSNAGAAVTGQNNSFFGVSAGQSSRAAVDNSFFGAFAGQSTTSGSSNSFFGQSAGVLNTIGIQNTFVGDFAGDVNQQGSENTFIGAGSGTANTFGARNTLVGSFANVGLGNLGNATAIGDRAFVSQSNSLVLGSIKGINNASADTNVGIGLTTPNSRLDVVDTAAQVHFGNSTSDSGGYLFSGTASQAIISGGAKWNGSAWVAKSTAASIIENRNGTTNFFNDSGLTAGSTFSPTQRVRITSAGDVGIGTSAPAAALDVRGDIKLGPNGQFFDIASSEKLLMVRGAVDNSGNILKGAGFTASHLATGVYELDFSPSFSQEPIITVTPRQFDSSKFAYFATVDDPYVFGKTVRIQIWSHTGASVDADFYFIAIGSR